MTQRTAPVPHLTRTVCSVFVAAAVLAAMAMAVVGSGPTRTAAQQDPTPQSQGGFFQQTPEPDDEDAPNGEGGGLIFGEPDSDVSDEGDSLEFGADAWQGGYYRGDAEWYGRPWTSVYGAQSDYPRATITFELARDPSSPLILTFDGLDDELPEQARIAVFVNGQRVFDGESWFGAWDGTGQGENAPWTTVELTIPAGLLLAGVNRVTVANETPAANFGSPPYVLLSAGTIESGEADIFGPAGEDEIAVEIRIAGSGD